MALIRSATVMMALWHKAHPYIAINETTDLVRGRPLFVGRWQVGFQRIYAQCVSPPTAIAEQQRNPLR